jgi:hypothetical protein
MRTPRSSWRTANAPSVRLVAAALASADHLVPLESPASTDRTASTETLVTSDLLDQLPKTTSTQHFDSHLSALATPQLDPKAHLEHLARPDLEVMPVHLVLMANLAMVAHVDPTAKLDDLAPLATREPLVRWDRSLRVSLEPPDQLANLADPDLAAPADPPDLAERMANLVPLVNPELLAMAAHPANLVNPEATESLAKQDPRALATTAHQHVWPQDIKIVPSRRLAWLVFTLVYHASHFHPHTSLIQCLN